MKYGQQRWALIMAGGLGLAIVSTSAAWAQPLRPTTPPATNPTAQPGTAAAGQPATGQPDAGQPATGQPATEGQPAAPAADPSAAGPQPAAPAAPATTPGPKLPPGFVPPRPTPEVMKIVKPLMTPEEVAKEDAELRKAVIGRILTQGQMNDQNKKLIDRWARFKIAQMTNTTNYTELGQITQSVTQDLRSAGITQSNENRLKEFREYLCGALATACTEALDNNFYVRMQAAILLSRLNVREDSGTKAPEAGYAPALGPLIDILENPEQPEAVKVVAAGGVARIAGSAEVVSSELRFRAANAVSSELRRTDTTYWYQMRLVEAIGNINIDYDANRKPVLLTTLTEIIGDSKRHPLVRSMAVRSLGRIPMPAEADPQQLGQLVTTAAVQMAQRYNASPTEVHWKETFYNLLLGFRPDARDRTERLALSSLVRRGSAMPGPLNETLQRILPLIKHVLSQPSGLGAQPIPAATLQPLTQEPAA